VNSATSQPMNRRESDRQSVVVNRARLEWWEKDAAYESPATLVNISQGGALLIAENPPPVDQQVWLRFEEPTTTDWVKARVVRNDSSPTTGLAFPQPCPYDFYMAAVLGFNLDGLITRPSTP
jgi:hypothetical protein